MKKSRAPAKKLLDDINEDINSRNWKRFTLRPKVLSDTSDEMKEKARVKQHQFLVTAPSSESNGDTDIEPPVTRWDMQQKDCLTVKKKFTQFNARLSESAQNQKYNNPLQVIIHRQKRQSECSSNRSWQTASGNNNTAHLLQEEESSWLLKKYSEQNPGNRQRQPKKPSPILGDLCDLFCCCCRPKSTKNRRHYADMDEIVIACESDFPQRFNFVPSSTPSERTVNSTGTSVKLF